MSCLFLIIPQKKFSGFDGTAQKQTIFAVFLFFTIAKRNQFT